MALLATPRQSQGVAVADKNDNEYRDLFAELNRVTTDKAEAATRDRISLRDAVCGYVALEQERGTALRTIIETVESILERANDRADNGSDTNPSRDGELAKQLVAWCLEFRGDGTVPAV